MRLKKREENAEFSFGINTTQLLNISYKSDPQFSDYLLLSFVNGQEDRIKAVDGIWKDGKRVSLDDNPSLKNDLEFKKEEDCLGYKMFNLLYTYVPEVEADVKYEKRFGNNDVSFKDLCMFIIDEIKGTGQLNKKIDVYCRYSANKEGTKFDPVTDKPIVGIPRNGEHGDIFCPHVETASKWVNTAERGVRFTNKEGASHPITRGTRYWSKFYVSDEIFNGLPRVNDLENPMALNSGLPESPFIDSPVDPNDLPF